MQWCDDVHAEAGLYVWPQRLAADVVQGTNERHYRRRRDLVWHPHPSYQLTLQVCFLSLFPQWFTADCNGDRIAIPYANRLNNQSIERDVLIRTEHLGHGWIWSSSVMMNCLSVDERMLSNWLTKPTTFRRQWNQLIGDHFEAASTAAKSSSHIHDRLAGTPRSSSASVTDW